MLTVFEVGQGDSFLLRPDNCSFSNPPLLIDTGPKGADVCGRIEENILSILLTHSHNDHIGGISKLINKKTINQIFVPYYLPEVSSIYKFIKKHTSLKFGQPNWARVNKLNFIMVSEGDKLCPQHIRVLNPPKNPFIYFSAFSSDNINIQMALNNLADFGIELPIDEILNYETPLNIKKYDKNDASAKVLSL